MPERLSSDGGVGNWKTALAEDKRESLKQSGSKVSILKLASPPSRPDNCNFIDIHELRRRETGR